MNYQHATIQVLNTIQASAADIVLNDRILKIGTTTNPSPQIHYLPDLHIAVRTSQDFIGQAFTVTPTFVALNYHSVAVMQYVDGIPYARTFEVLAVAGDNLASVITKLVAQINAASATGYFNLTAVGNGGTTITVTSTDGPITVVGKTNVAAVRIANSAIASFGQGADVVSDLSQLLDRIAVAPAAANSYTVIDFRYGREQFPLNNQQRHGAGHHILFVSEDATNYAAFMTALNAIRNGTYNAEMLAVPN